MQLNEANTRTRLINPKLEDSGWKPELRYEEYTFTDGKKTPGGGTGEQCHVDYLLQYNESNLAVIEAKREGLPVTQGLQQAQGYAKKLGVRIVYSTNGHGIFEYDFASDSGREIDKYPTPEELYIRLHGDNPLKQKLLKQPLKIEGAMKPRYYQKLSVQRVMEAISEGKKRILLTLATGTGKTFIAYQIVQKLFNLRWRLDGRDQRPKILFLADRNILVDQAINTFNSMEKDVIKIDGREIKKRYGKVPYSANIFFAIYQAITGSKSDNDEILEYYKQYPKDFFDMVIIDECHRGSANEEGSWRHVLDHFDKAIHLGLTATPKRDDNVDTYNYFGKPVYEYSLKEGINDGFLTPYKVKRVRTSLDEYIYKKGDTIKQGELDKDRYDISDFNRNIILEDRIDAIAQSILNLIEKMDKTIVFCVNQLHALNLRNAINKHKQVADHNYCVRVTSDEKNGRTYLEQFQNNDKDLPVILTSSQMLTTGVDARNVRNIVLVRNVNSMVEFKQIVGRGTRIFDGKDYFTIIDYTGATNNFYDEEWDGVAEEVEVVNNEKKRKERKVKEFDDSVIKEPKKEKVVVLLSGNRSVKIIDVDTRYVGADGTPLSAEEFLKQLVGSLPDIYENEEQLREKWADPDTREEVFDKLASCGFADNHLQDLKKMMNAEDSDIFDVLAYLSFNKPMKTRKERVIKTKGNAEVFEVYSDYKAKDFLNFILERYEKDGVEELRRDKLGDLIGLSDLGKIKDAGIVFGGLSNLEQAFVNLQKILYKAS